MAKSAPAARDLVLGALADEAPVREHGFTLVAVDGVDGSGKTDPSTPRLK